MKPATAPRRPSKLLSIAADHSSVHPLNDLPLLVKPGDVWVVNDAATFPASLHGRTETGAEIELRLFPHPPSSTRPWSAVLFGAGNWRTKTEDRLAPPSLRMGERIYFENDSVSIRGISVLSPRLLEINFERSEFETWQFIYRIGKPIQYSYLAEPLEHWSVQTVYATRPWASEMPSAGYPLTWSLLREVEARGAHLHFLTHATGLSTTGVSNLDSRLPLPEFFDIPLSTVIAIKRAKKEGSRIIAVGTSVMRALEGSAQTVYGLSDGPGETNLKITPDFSRRIVDGILSGLHSPGESHFELLQSFVNRDRLEIAERLAETEKLLSHEFGDTCFVTT